MKLCKMALALAFSLLIFLQSCKSVDHSDELQSENSVEVDASTSSNQTLGFLADQSNSASLDPAYRPHPKPEALLFAHSGFYFHRPLKNINTCLYAMLETLTPKMPKSGIIRIDANLDILNCMKNTGGDQQPKIYAATFRIFRQLECRDDYFERYQDDHEKLSFLRLSPNLCLKSRSALFSFQNEARIVFENVDSNDAKTNQNDSPNPRTLIIRTRSNMNQKKCLFSRELDQWSAKDCEINVSVRRRDPNDREDVTKLENWDLNFNQVLGSFAGRPIFYGSGSMDVRLNDWKGKIDFRSMKLEPIWQLQNDSEVRTGTLPIESAYLSDGKTPWYLKSLMPFLTGMFFQPNG